MLIIRHSKPFRCNKLRVYTHLCNDGLIPMYTEKDTKNPYYNVWVFRNTPQLRDSLRKYFGAENIKII